MAEADGITPEIEKLIGASITFARAAERVVAAQSTLVPVANSLRRIVELDADLAPEVLAALEHLDGATDAITRLGEFISARYEVVIAPYNEGGQT